MIVEWDNERGKLMNCWLAMLFVYWSIDVNVPMHVIGTDGTYMFRAEV